MNKPKPQRFLNPNSVKLYSLSELENAVSEKDNDTLRKFFEDVAPKHALNIDYSLTHPVLHFRFTIECKTVAKGFIDIVHMHGETEEKGNPEASGFIIL